MSQKKFYITTPIYYVNDVPHIGHLYTTIVADVLARYHRLLGDEVYFLTGTDENSQKNIEAAEKHGYKEIQPYLDMMSTKWQSTFKELGISFDDFIRTTDDRHKKGVEKFWKVVFEKGDIYQGEYEGLYCAGCEAFVVESELVEGKCAMHKKEPIKLKEKNYFFKLSAYREKLLAHIESHPEFVQPESRRNEVRSYITSFMNDVSISRESMKWGIRVPNDQTSVIYVWFDALLNYLTGIGYGTDEKKYETFWPANIQLVGKDIIKFHCAMWPAMLMSAGLPLPTTVFAHGFFTINGEKMSKSLGNVIDPIAAANICGIDALRYFLLREIPFGSDGDFSLERLRGRYSGDLANELGNLLHRVLSMTEKYFESRVPVKPEGSLAPQWELYEKGMHTLHFSAVLDVVWGILHDANKFIDMEKPWVLAKTDKERLAKDLALLLEQLRHIAWMLRPIMPGIAENMLTQLGIFEKEREKTLQEAQVWGGIQEGDTIMKGLPLFPRIEV